MLQDGEGWLPWVLRVPGSLVAAETVSEPEMVEAITPAATEENVPALPHPS